MTIKTDVAVIGSGLAGTSAALALAEKGINSVLIEKRPFQGGAVSNCPMCFSACDNDREKQDKAYNSWVEGTNFDCNMRAVRNYINNSWRVPKFVEHLNIDYLFHIPADLESIGTVQGYGGWFPKMINIGDTYMLKPIGLGHGAAPIVLKAVKQYQKLGGTVYFRTALESIKTENGKVTGAVLKNVKTGEKIDLECKALLIASGGFSNNPDMIQEHLGLKYTDQYCSDGGEVFFNHFTNGQLTGDGQKAVWEIGGAVGVAELSGSIMVPGPGLLLDKFPWTQPHKIHEIQEQPYLTVNQKGKRFVREDEKHNAIHIRQALYAQPGKYAWTIFDAESKRQMEEDGVVFSYMVFQENKMPDIDKQWRSLIDDYGNKHLACADTIEELCEKTGIDYEGLSETLERYNRFCDNGYDEDFNSKYIFPVRKGKFYAIRIYPNGYATVGGIRTDGECRVLDTKLDTIPGLYAAGDCTAAELYGIRAPRAACGLFSIAVTQGLISADKMAEYIEEAGK